MKAFLNISLNSLWVFLSSGLAVLVDSVTRLLARRPKLHDIWHTASRNEWLTHVNEEIRLGNSKYNFLISRPQIFWKNQGLKTDIRVFKRIVGKYSVLAMWLPFYSTLLTRTRFAESSRLVDSNNKMLEPTRNRARRTQTVSMCCFELWMLVCRKIGSWKREENSGWKKKKMIEFEKKEG